MNWNGGKKEALRTNGFSCLKELDYWMNSGEHEDRYYQKFPNGFELNSTIAHLISVICWMHLMLADIIFNYDKILRSVAEKMYLPILQARQAAILPQARYGFSV